MAPRARARAGRTTLESALRSSPRLPARVRVCECVGASALKQSSLHSTGAAGSARARLQAAPQTADAPHPGDSGRAANQRAREASGWLAEDPARTRPSYAGCTSRPGQRVSPPAATARARERERLGTTDVRSRGSCSCRACSKGLLFIDEDCKAAAQGVRSSRGPAAGDAGAADGAEHANCRLCDERATAPLRPLSPIPGRAGTIPKASVAMQSQRSSRRARQSRATSSPARGRCRSKRPVREQAWRATTRPRATLAECWHR